MGKSLFCLILSSWFKKKNGGSKVVIPNWWEMRLFRGLLKSKGKGMQ